MENNQTNNVIDNEPVTCYEDIGERTEYSKKFTNPKTGLHTAVLFSSPVNNNDGIETAADGEDLIDAVNDEGEEVFESRRNKFLVRLAKSTAQNKLVELIQDDYKIAMSPVAAVTSKLNRFVGTIRRDIQAIRNLRRNPKATTNKITELIHGAVKFALKDREPSDVRFANIINNCDLEYLVENNRLKENIIVNAKSEAYEYLFNLNLGKLEARISGKQIELYDAATNEVKFLIPAPYMYDMANEQSDAVEYLLEGGAGNYTLRVIADETWINAAERMFPVVIDPQIMGNTETIISFKGGSRTGNFTTPTGDCIAIGNNHYDNADHEYTAQITLHGNAIRQHIGKELKITHAILELTKTGEDRASGSTGFNVRKDSVTGTVIDRFIYNGINNRIEIDITEQMQEIIDGTTDKSLFIDRVNTDSRTDYLLIATALAANAEYKPRIFVDYVSARINTDDMPFASVSAGKGGSGKVNLVTGNLLWEVPEVQIKSRGVELSVSHVYDGYLSGKDQDYINSANASLPKTPKLCCGKGFKLNIQQYLLEKKYASAVSLLGTRNFVYIDGSGNHHDFVEKYYYTDDNKCKRFIERINCAEDVDGNLTFVADGKTYDVKHELDNELGLTLETYKDLLAYVLDGKAYSVSYYRIENGRKVSVPSDRAGESGVYAERNYGDGIKVGISDKLDIKEVEEAKAAVDECELKIEEVKSQIQSGQYSGEAYALLQRKQKRYEAELADKTTKLNKAISDKKRNPVDFITNGNGQTLGFDYYGRLVLISNGSESGSAFIIYNTDDRIERVVDKDGIPLVAFGYKDDLLEYMTDKNGKTFRYEYDSSKRLLRISYGDEVLCEFGYSSYKLNSVVKKFSSKVLNGVKIVYTSGKPTVMQEYSEMLEISETNCDYGATLYAKNLSISYVDRYMATIKDVKTDITTTYIMDNMGRIVTAYEGSGSNIKSVSIEYRERNRAFSSNDLFTDNKTITYAADSGLTAVSTRKVYTMDDSAKIAKIPKSGMMLLSAWATAQSFNLIYHRRQTAYGDDIFGHYELDANNSADVQRSNRRFELFAKVYYTDGTTPDAHYASFDYYNPHKQLGILPIYVNPSLVTKVSKIEYGVNYSYNNGTADFEDLKLTTCKGGTYREFDDDDLLLKETTDDGFTEYEYADRMPIKATFTRSSDDKSFVSLRDYDTMGRERFVRGFDGNCKATFYDDNGMVSKTEEYHESDTTTKRVKEYKYDNDGNVMYESDERGESGGQELYKINYIDNGVTTRTRNSGGAVTATGYDRYTGENTGLSGDADGNPSTAQYTYKHGMMIKATHNGFDIDYSYDGLGRVKTLKIGGQSVISSCVYDDATHTSTVTGTYGIAVMTETDVKGNTVSIQWDNVEKLHNVIDEKYRVKASEDKYANITYHNYYGTGENESDFSVYTQAEQVVKKEEFNNRAKTIQTSKLSFYKQADSTFVADTGEIVGTPEKTRSTKVHFDKNGYDDIETKVELPSGIDIYPELDDLGRYAGCVQKQQGYGTPLITENRYYVKHGDRTCDLIASERFGVNGVINEHIRYSYDAAGNISAIYINGEAVYGYGYDSLNRLVREEKYLDKQSIEYVYDIGGNIIKKITKDSKMGRNIEEKSFVYKANGWRDCLTEIITKTIVYNEDGTVNAKDTKTTTEEITYDNYGRAADYRDKKFVFSKFLDTVKNESNSVIAEYKYNINGLRISKKANNKTTEFFYDGTKLVRSFIDKGRDIWYNYGINGIQGITVKEAGASTSTEYVLRKNAQGDVTHIYKMNSGTLELMAQYKYDAWGDHTVYKADGKTKDDDANSIGNINPIRYRGYYYDSETGLYYLKTRYYDSKTGRFISADDTQYLDPQTVNGLNLFIYCGNNPVMNVDENGNSWKSFWKGVGNWFKKNWKIVVGVVVAAACVVASIATFGIATVAVGMVTGALVGAGYGALNAYINGDNILYGAFSGMLVGALSGLGGGGFGGMLLAGVGSFFGAAALSLIGDDVNHRERNETKALVSGITAGVFNFLGAGFGNLMNLSGECLAVKIIGNLVNSFIFTSYSFIGDIIYDVLFGGRKSKAKKALQV